MNADSQSAPAPAKDAETSKSTRNRRIGYALIILAATIVGAIQILMALPLRSANDRSRWATVWSLVERGTYQIDEIDSQRFQIEGRKGKHGWGTIDKVKHEKHFYSTKPPLFPTLVAGLYWTVKKTLDWDIYRDGWIDARVTRLILLLVNLVPTIVCLILLAAILERHARSNLTRYFVLSTAAFATLLVPFLGILNNHTVGAYSAMFALYAMIRVIVDGKRKPVYFALCGFWAAFTCCNELPAALFGLATFGLMLRTCRRQTLVWFVPAALVPLVGFFYTNYLATGGWKPFYLYYGTEKYNFVQNGRESYWMNPKGIDKGGDAPWSYFLHCTVGHHGILSLTPVYLLTLLAWFRLGRYRDFKLRPIMMLGLALSVCVLGFYLTRTGNYNYGGVSVALRWMLWLTPFWLIAMIPLTDDLAKSDWFPGLAVIILLVSLFSAWYPHANPWQHPWLFQVMEWADLIHYD